MECSPHPSHGPGTGQLTTGAQRRGEAREPRAAKTSTPLCLQALPGSRGRGEGPAKAGPRTPGDAHSGAGGILPSPLPAWGLRARGPPVGSRGAATSRRVCPQAERRAGEEPRAFQPRRSRPRPYRSPHRAPRPAAPPLTFLPGCPGSDGPHGPPD